MTLRQPDAHSGSVSANFAMPVEHTTGVHNLFKWPWIKILLPKNQSLSYVWELETTGGLLDNESSHVGQVPSPASSSSSKDTRLEGTMWSGSPYEVGWNNQASTLPISSNRDVEQIHIGVGSPRVDPMLDPAEVDRYVQAYMDRMHMLHPFLEPETLRRSVQAFKRKNGCEKSVVRGTKRKRGAPNRSVQARREEDKACLTKLVHPVHHAIVLLVIALGQTCTHRRPIPGSADTSVVYPWTQRTIHSTVIDLPSPQSLPKSSWDTQTDRKGSETVKMSSVLTPPGTSMDLIPGYSCFAAATSILGHFPGGADVPHVQANLLAGLYMGQLTRVVCSHHYISVACRVCQILIQSPDYTSHAMNAAQRRSINFAFWSCLQLESDILAEIELPPSGIARYERAQEREITTEATMSQDDFDILRFYRHQIQMRRTLKEVHSELYQGPKQHQPPFLVIHALIRNLEAWRKTLADLDWDDDDHQSDDINVARMRAKYYGAKYLIHRPGMEHALQCTHNGVRLDHDTLSAAQTCVAAAIRSTTVFDKVPRPWIVTNIFGTAHA